MAKEITEDTLKALSQVIKKATGDCDHILLLMTGVEIKEHAVGACLLTSTVDPDTANSILLSILCSQDAFDNMKEDHDALRSIVPAACDLLTKEFGEDVGARLRDPFNRLSEKLDLLIKDNDDE